MTICQPGTGIPEQHTAQCGYVLSRARAKSSGSTLINLKEAFRQHFRFDARGGLEKVVNSLLELRFEGRAHSALVDARNTGKIALRMCEQSFRFTRPTRGLGPDGEPWGGGKSKMKALPQDDAVAKSGVPSAAASGSGSATYSGSGSATQQSQPGGTAKRMKAVLEDDTRKYL